MKIHSHQIIILTYNTVQTYYSHITKFYQNVKIIFVYHENVSQQFPFHHDRNPAPIEDIIIILYYYNNLQFIKLFPNSFVSMPPISASFSFSTTEESPTMEPFDENNPDSNAAAVAAIPPSTEERVNEMQSQLSTITTLLAQLVMNAKAVPSTPVSSTAAAIPSTPTNSRYTSEAVGDDYDFLGIDDLLTSPRNQADAKLSGINALSGKDRMELSTTDKNKMWKEAIRGLHPDKFKGLTTLSSGLENLVSMEHIVRLDDMIQRLQKYIASFGMLNVFYIIQFDINDNPKKLDSSSINIFETYHSVKLYEVEQTVQYYMRYGREYHHENLKWSFDAIMNSCTPELKETLQGKMKVVSDELQTGPILFMMLMKQLTNVSPQASRLVTNKIESLTMNSFEGESIALANKTIHAAHKWLSMINKVPNDFEMIVLAIYKTSSIPSFLRFLEAVKLHGMGFGSTMSHEMLMEISHNFYEEATLEGTWDRSTNASFNNANGRNRIANPLYLAPAEGASEIKDIFGVPHKFCKVCKRWTYGNRAHVTGDHIVKARNDAPAVPTVPSTTAPRNPTSESPRLSRNTEFRRVNFSSGM